MAVPVVKRLVILEAPYGQDPEKFTPYLAECIKDTLARGEAAMTSVAVYALTGALKDAVPEQRRAGIEAGLEWYRVADAAVVYVDHGISKGMQEGIEKALACGVSVEHRELYPATD